MDNKCSSMHDDSWHLQTGRLLRVSAVRSSKERLHGQHLSNEHCQRAAFHHADTHAQGQGAATTVWHPACLPQQGCGGPMLSNRLCQHTVCCKTLRTDW